MAFTPEIAFEDMPASPEIEARIREKTEWLARFSSHIMACRVVVQMPHQRHHTGNLYGLKIHLRLPSGGNIVVSRRPDAHHAHEDFQVTLRDAFDAARRQLEDWERKHSQQVKQHELPPHGWIARLFPADGYGFIATPDERELYFHRNSVADEAFDNLAVGEEVRFSESMGDKGPQASSVHVIAHRHTD